MDEFKIQIICIIKTLSVIFINDYKMMIIRS